MSDYSVGDTILVPAKVVGIDKGTQISRMEVGEDGKALRDENGAGIPHATHGTFPDPRLHLEVEGADGHANKVTIPARLVVASKPAKLVPELKADPILQPTAVI